MMINPNKMIALCCCLILASLPGCSPKEKEKEKESDLPDVGFAKRAFFSMVNGSAAEGIIDWETFRAMGEDLGPKYRALATDAEKAAARKSFLAGFAVSTPNIRANPEAITNWRVKSETPSETVVAADMQKGAVLLLTVSKRDGTQRISAMELQR
jgi:hypothetical protein